MAEYFGRVRVISVLTFNFLSTSYLDLNVMFISESAAATPPSPESIPLNQLETPLTEPRVKSSIEAVKPVESAKSVETVKSSV